MRLVESIKSGKTTLVNLHANWCMPCQVMKPHLEQVVDKMGDQIHFERIDIDQNPELASVFQIQSIPTTIIFKDSEVKWRQSGVLPAHTLSQILEEQIQSKD